MQHRIWVWIAHVSVWLIAFLIFSPWPIDVISLGMEPFTRMELTLFLGYGFVLSIVMVYTYAHYRLPVFLRKPSISTLFLVNIGYLLGFSLLESGLDYLFISTLYPDLGNRIFQELHFHSLNAFWNFFMANLLITFLMLMVANFYGFSYAWFKDQKVKSEMKRQTLEAELSALKHQINPHFLFNVLNALYGMAFENDDEDTAEGIAKLSRMMRYVLYESNGEEESLKKEVEYIQNYIDLQKLRVPESVAINFTVEGRLEGHRVAPMIFLPFVENAFKYGISLVNESFIDIRMEVAPTQLRFRCVNSYHASTQKDTLHKGIGLKNVKKRLRLLCPDTHCLEVTQNDSVYIVDLELELTDPLARKLPALFSGPLKKT
ncbi:MAG: histidine kinase [Bacteroidota bacterium]